MSVESRTQPRSHNPSGIYLGMVVNHLDTKFNGNLEVEILKATESGNLSARTGQIVQVKYMSPFYGVSPYQHMTKNDGYTNTQKSYGFWAIPPDPGTLVIVLFTENNFGRGYWIGCVQDEYMNFMVPGYASTTYNDNDSSLALPVGEYNRKVETGSGKDPTKFVKPHSEKALELLEKNGLKLDHIRGTTTSSARREAPSMVFGMSTPGPVDKDGPKYPYGPQGSRINVPFSRLGGSSFVMDDGDMSLLRKKPAGGDEAGPMEYANVEAGETDGDATLPANELVRIRTRTGHQILLHNTEDLVYISHGSGNSWIELSANGKIDIYAADSISVHSENDINFKADRDINFEAGNNFNFTAGANFFLSAGNNWELKAGADGKLTAASSTHINTQTHSETAPAGVYMNSESSAASEAAEASIPVRIPQHEPWSDHEHTNPEEFVPDKTVAINPGDKVGDYINLTQSEAPEFPKIPDTFKKPT
jgi:hypothetical protein